ncbi:glycerol-3-phosphate O-acyltransferase [Allopseudospirillum japonicum]|uniref:Glycerol-3-phosphate acyltransferase n=1 Tax=Allopseudospirillum japonicum TaxID=64971 RepID=A0A1H6S193_9GAMM|nr:1-acyl-sn-glycerol-3-phosphate acyltransferase [Allopseudospirillum japonicum]SEI57800.1 glycerol-3-phosphate O-acyltransferase [Allopseudospirillum japonicum]
MKFFSSFAHRIAAWRAHRVVHRWSITHYAYTPSKTLPLSAESPCCHLHLYVGLDPCSNLPILAKLCQQMTGLTPCTQTQDLDPHASQIAYVLSYQQQDLKQWRALLQWIQAHPQVKVSVQSVHLHWGRNANALASWPAPLLRYTYAHFSWMRLQHSSGRRLYVQWGRPWPLKLTQNADIIAEVGRLGRFCRWQFHLMRRQLLGAPAPDTARSLSQILTYPPLQADLALHASTPELVQKKLQHYFTEIRAALSWPWIRRFETSLTWLWQTAYQGIEIQGAQDLPSLAASHTLVYVPCHRSHIDYLLLSYVLFHQGLAVPYVAAGVNLNIPLLGPLLRRGGAFFMRRSFRQQGTYPQVFAAYLTSLLARGQPIEFFIEGGRSRNGRLLTPRLGLVSMCVRAALLKPKRPLAFIPVYIGYESVFELPAYLQQLQGLPKRKESLPHLLASVMRLRPPLGQVQVSFGQPLVLDAFLQQQTPEWRAYKGQGIPEDSVPAFWSASLQRLGDELRLGIAAATQAQAIDLLALVWTSFTYTQASQLTPTQLDIVWDDYRGWYPQYAKTSYQDACQASLHPISYTLPDTDLYQRLAYHKNALAPQHLLRAHLWLYLHSQGGQASELATLAALEKLWPHLQAEWPLPPLKLQTLRSTVAACPWINQQAQDYQLLVTDAHQVIGQSLQGLVYATWIRFYLLLIASQNYPKDQQQAQAFALQAARAWAQKIHGPWVDYGDAYLLQQQAQQIQATVAQYGYFSLRGCLQFSGILTRKQRRALRQHVQALLDAHGG